MTKYIKEVDLDNEAILEIADGIRNGKIVVFKTDTVYGIGTNAFLEEACMRIYKIKERPMNKPLSVLVSDISMLKKIVDFISPVEHKLIDAFWPDALTIKFKKKKNVLPNIISAGDCYVRVRLLSQGLVHDLIKIAGVPVVALSANLSGSFTGRKVKNIVNELGGKLIIY